MKNICDEILNLCNEEYDEEGANELEQYIGTQWSEGLERLGVVIEKLKKKKKKGTYTSEDAENDFNNLVTAGAKEYIKEFYSSDITPKDAGMGNASRSFLSRKFVKDFEVRFEAGQFDSVY